MLARERAAGGRPRRGARGRGRAARDQHVLHHRARPRRSRASRSGARCKSAARGVRRRLRGQPERATVRRARPAGDAVRRDRRRRRRRSAQSAAAPTLEHDVLARQTSRAGGADARLRQGPGRLRLRAAPTASSRPSAAAPARVRRARCSTRCAAASRQGQPEMVMTGISVGDYRDPERGLELGELMVEVARVAGSAARPAVQRRGDPRQGLAARGACDRAEGLPAPARADAVGRRRRAARRWAATTPRPSTSTHIAAVRAAVPEVNVTTDVIVGFPDRGRGRVRAHAGGGRRRRDHARARVPVLAAPGTAAAALGDRVAAAGEEAPLRGPARPLRGPLAPPSRAPSSAGASGCSSTRSPTRSARATPPTTRAATCRPRAAHAASSSTSVCEELHADGIACAIS